MKQAQRKALGEEKQEEERAGIEGAHQANAAEAAAEGLVKDGAIEGQLLKVALGQPYVSWE